ncbi:MAG: enoyl-CoA hydratase-related protein [Alphaproteobacteria bacterium]|nr:enoyl-CoA hydratase-related protein [Alphaproteobacteria bacterium]
MANEVLSEMRGQALIITINNPDRGNAMSFDMAVQLFNLLKNVTTDRAVRAVLLQGKGSHFMDGLDMNLYAGDVGGALDRANQMVQPYHSAIRELQAMEKPVLAAVNGRVAGPGMSFMLASDLVLAARSTKFNCDFTTHALSPDGGASFFLTRQVGAAKANELLMLSEEFSVEDAEKWGLVNSVIDDEKLHDAALAWVDRLATGPTRAFGAVKMLVGRAYEQNLTTHLGLEHTYWGACSRTFDFKEAIRAYFAKRPAKYSGA